MRTVLETAAVQGWGTTRKMPQFDLSKQDIDDLVEFFKWMNQIDTNNWPLTRKAEKRAALVNEAAKRLLTGQNNQETIE